MASLRQDCPLPLHPYPQKNGGKGDHKTSTEQTVGLHFDFARRLHQSYILQLLDRATLWELLEQANRRQPRQPASRKIRGDISWLSRPSLRFLFANAGHYVFNDGLDHVGRQGKRVTL